MSEYLYGFLLIFFFILICLFASAIVIIPHDHTAIYERCYQEGRLYHPGLYFLHPFLYRNRPMRSTIEYRKLDGSFSRQQISWHHIRKSPLLFDPPPIQVRTSDLSEIELDLVLSIRVGDVKALVYSDNPLGVLFQHLQTSLVSISSRYLLSEILHERSKLVLDLLPALSHMSEYGLTISDIRVQHVSVDPKLVQQSTASLLAKKKVEDDIKMSQLKSNQAMTEQTLQLKLQQQRDEAAREKQRSEAELKLEIDRIQHEAEIKRKREELEVESKAIKEFGDSAYRLLVLKKWSEIVGQSKTIVISPDVAAMWKYGNIGTETEQLQKLL